MLVFTLRRYICSVNYFSDNVFTFRLSPYNLSLSLSLTLTGITCPTILPHNNATQTGFGYRYLDRISWTCHTGYERNSGSFNAQCQANRQWSAAQLTCNDASNTTKIALSFCQLIKNTLSDWKAMNIKWWSRQFALILQSRLWRCSEEAHFG